MKRIDTATVFMKFTWKNFSSITYAYTERPFLHEKDKERENNINKKEKD
jgi:hypothetical protein